MTHYYFAYGANTNLDSMAIRCPNSRSVGMGQLEGYKFSFRLHADVELGNVTDRVDGVVWEVDDYDLDSLDSFEGFPTYYLRTKVWVHCNEIGWVKAWIYFMSNQDYVQHPRSSYLQLCLTGYEQNNVDTSQIYKALHEIDAMSLENSNALD
jgi:gamma-glutamylcyclotransferase (GGCT)/AIG2-like uncharacterized protein YtfP